MRFAFVAIMAIWLALAFVWTGAAQDAVPFGVAGRLLHDHPEDVYVAKDAGSAHAVRPRFKQASCVYYDTQQECDETVVAFVSAPIALPLVVPLGWLDHHMSIAMRLIGAAAFVGAMAIAWRRLAGIHPRAPAALVATAALLTPLVSFTIAIGQNAPLLFLAAMIPIADCSRGWKRWAAAALVVVTAAFKVWPALVVGVLVAGRRKKLLAAIGWIVVGLTALTALLAPAWIVRSFLEANATTSHHTAELWNNGSLDAALFRLSVPVQLVGALAWLIRAVVAPLLVRVYRVAPHDARWSFGWLAALLFFPQVWGHYLFVGVAAAAVAVAARPQGGSRIWVLPAAAAIAGFAGWLSTIGAPIVQCAAVIALLGLVSWTLATGATEEEPELVADLVLADA